MSDELDTDPRRLLAANLRRLAEADPRTPAELQAMIWPEAKRNTAAKRWRILLGDEPKPGSWPRAEAFAQLAEVLGVQPFELLLPTTSVKIEDSGDRS